VKEAAAVPWNFTDETPVKPVPVMVTLVPPTLTPEEGLIAVTTGDPGVTTVDWV